MGTTTVFTDKTDRVGVVYHHQGIVFICQIANAFQVGNHAVHREHTIGGNQHMTRTGFTRFFQTCFQLLYIVVGIAIAFSFTQTHTINNRRVVQCVGDNGVFRAQQRFKQATVSIKAGRVENRIFHPQECRQFLFKLFMAVLSAANKTHRSHAETVRIHSRLCRRNQIRMIRQPEIVIGTKVNDVASISHSDICLLRRRNNALFFKQPFRPCGFQIVG